MAEYIIPIAGIVIGAAGTAYSAYSSRQARKEGEVDAVSPKDLSAEKAASAEAERIRKRKLTSTIKTSAGGLMEAPTIFKEKLGE